MSVKMLVVLVLSLAFLSLLFAFVIDLFRTVRSSNRTIKRVK